jgi:hypothetical protein
MVTWDECCHAFEPDGDLRDILVQPAGGYTHAMEVRTDPGGRAGSRRSGAEVPATL